MCQQTAAPRRRGRRRGNSHCGAPLFAAAVCALGSAVEGRISGGKYHIDRFVGGTDSTGPGVGGQVVYLGTFGYSSMGQCNVKVTNNATRHGELSRSGFFLQKVVNVNTARAEQMTTDEFRLCRDTPSEEGLSMIQMQPTTEPKTWKGSATISEGGFWALFFYNCRRAEVHLHVGVSQFNVIDTDGTRNYLQVGDWPLPRVYLSIFCIYSFLLFVWGYTMHTNRKYLHKIHFLMALLLALKTGTMLFESLKYFAFRETGTGSTWDVFYYTFLMLKGIALFLAILLLGTGWSFLKPFLAEKDKKILLLVLPLQVVVNICDIVIDETTEGDPSWKAWQDALRIFDIVCCCVVLLPIVWSVKSLKDASAADGKVARNLTRLRQFRTFYILVVAYIYFTRIIVVLVESALHSTDTWMTAVILEVGTLFFYVITGNKFRPVKQNPYLALQEEDWVEGGIELQEEVQQHQREQQEKSAEDGQTLKVAKPALSEI